MQSKNVTQRWFTITVDTEEEWDWSSGYPTGPASVSNIAGLRRFQTECQKHDATVTYFTNHSVLSHDSSAQVILDLHDSGKAEIGLHIHPWNTPPISADEQVTPRNSFLHNLPQEEALAKLQNVYDAFDSRGLPVPTSFRGGRYSTSRWIQTFLSGNGCRADASILPYTTWPDDGAPDFRTRDPWPVRRVFENVKHPLWEIPLTLAFTRQPWSFWRRFFQLGEKAPFRQFKCVGIAERLFVQKTWLNLEHSLGERCVDLLRIVRKTNLPCINFTLHSSSLVPGLSPYTRTSADVERLYSRLNNVLTFLKKCPEFQPATVSEVADNLERKHHARSRN